MQSWFQKLGKKRSGEANSPSSTSSSGGGSIPFRSSLSGGSGGGRNDSYNSGGGSKGTVTSTLSAGEELIKGQLITRYVAMI